MKNKKAGFLVLLVIVVIIILIFAKDNSNESKEILRIGAIYDLSGPLASLGEELQKGAILAEEHINARGGVRGQNIKYIFEDSSFIQKNAVSAYNKLVSVEEIDILSVLGAAISLSLKERVENEGILMYSLSTHPDVITNTHHILRHANSAQSDAELMAEDIAGINPKNVATIFMQDDWGFFFNEIFEKHLTELVPGVGYVSVGHNSDENEFRSKIATLLESNPEAFMVASTGAPAGIIIRQLKELGYDGEIYTGVGIVISRDAQNILGEEGLRGVHYQTYPELSPEFQRDYKERFGEEAGLFGVYMYTGTEILAHAIEQVGLDNKKIVDYVKTIGTFEGTYESLNITPQGEIIIPTYIVIGE